VYQVVHDLFYDRQCIDELATVVASLAREHGTVEAAQYRDAVLALGGVQRWIAEARNETAFLVEDEPYRRAP